jgi:hypothetical protein
LDLETPFHVKTENEEKKKTKFSKEEICRTILKYWLGTCWELVGNFLGDCWEIVGNLLGTFMEIVGNLLGTC